MILSKYNFDDLTISYYRIPPGTSSHLCDLLMGLLRRNAKDRMPFDTFFNHQFLQRPQTPPTPGIFSIVITLEKYNFQSLKIFVNT